MADEPRDRQSQGTSRSLVPMGGYSLNWSGGGQGWFGPLAPMNPVAPDSVKGRLFDYQSGFNLQIRPKANDPITFEQLRNFADAFDLLRIVIETRKDQLARLRWNIGVRQQFNEKKKDEALLAKIDLILEFFIRPDKENFWADWLRMLLEDLFVIDAPAIHRRRTFGGDLHALDPLDGATIKRVIDDHARTPEPPLPAYQQILKGMPAVDYTTAELLYRPRNKRTHKAYGFSPVEQIIMTINIAIRRQVWQLQSFTEGNIPEALIGVPATWTPDQIIAFQDAFDAMLEGNSAARRKAKFVPGDIAKSYFATKPDKLFDKETEEWMARVVCFAFSISPQPFIQMMNRATAETAQETAIQDGLSPIMGWVKSLIDTVILEDFEAPELEFLWVEEDELDPDKKSQIIDREQAAGRLTLNQSLKEQGLDPHPDPRADIPMIRKTDGTWVPLFPDEEEEGMSSEDIQAMALNGAQIKALADMVQQVVNEGLSEETGVILVSIAFPAIPEDRVKGLIAAAAKQEPLPSPIPTVDPVTGEPLPVPPGAPGAAVLDPAAEASDADLSADDEIADVDEVPEPGADEEVDAKPKKKEGAEKSDRPFLHRCGSGGRLTKTTPPRKTYVDPERKSAKKHEKKARTRLAAALATLGADIAAQVKAKLKSLGKAEPVDSPIDIDEILRGLHIEFDADLRDELAESLDEVFSDAGRLALGQLGSRLTSDLVDQVNERSVGWSRDNAADLVSQIEESTRDMLRATITTGIEDNLSAEAIADSLADGYGLSEERASLIAMTEIASANSLGALAGYEEAANDGVKIKKSWLILGDACEDCQANADDGVIDLDQPFSSGDDAPPAHPNCRCVLVPEVEDEDGNVEELDEIEAE